MPDADADRSLPFFGRRLLVVTDVPFWRRRNGSHARIATLLATLAGRGFRTRVRMLGQFDRSERRRAIESGSPCEWSFDERWFDRLGRTVSNLFGGGRSEAPEGVSVSRASDSGSPTPSSESEPFALPDPIPRFLDPRHGIRFAAEVGAFRPDVVLIEYLSLASLLDHLPSTIERPITLLDAHDVLSSRHRAALARGETSWLAIDEGTELRWAGRFDLVAAIQSPDRDFFARALGDRAIEVGHGLIGPTLPGREGGDSVRFGMFAGDGQANRRGAMWLIEQVWPRVREALPTSELELAGTLQIDRSVEAEGVVRRGPVDQPIDFYRRIDVALNPVDFASGLKIKSVEALAFGRPLVTRAAGAIGLETADGRAVLRGDDPASFAEAMIELGRSASMREAACQVARNEGARWSPERVVAGLEHRLIALLAERRPTTASR
ncbi:MAG TPA: hypothetical protein DCQ98_09025 [Planctomycetaceae bacterium]|nr:hypothetical protein [Planctomycetaceae bacterium]